jgi:hypothetical protein
MATQRPGDEQILQRLDSSISGLDDQRTENLKRTQLLQTNKDKALKKEQARLQKKYGPDHPRVAKITNRLDYNQAALPEMKTEIERSQIKSPEFDTNTWMVHGRVLNQNLTGIKGLTLALYDANGKVEKRLEYACTDERGYYAIRYQVKEGETPPFDEKADYFLTVTDSQGKVCHKEEQPLHVTIGQTDYRVIVLDDTKCIPPPGWGDDGNGGEDDDGSEIGKWTVAGKVTYDDNKPGSSLTVQVFSLPENKSLAKAKTNRSGVFNYVFTTEKFPDLFEKKPDLYLVISDQAGKELHRTDEPLKPKIGEVENIKIVLKRNIDSRE